MPVFSASYGFVTLSSTAWYSSVAIVLLIIIAVLAPWIVPSDPNEPDANAVLQGPSWSHVLGTDDFGRDELSRIIIASRVDLLVPIVSTLLALLIGSLIGALSGFRGGWLDQIVMRIVDTNFSPSGSDRR